MLFVLKGFAPGWRSLHTDFPNYYLVARLLREHYTMDRIYDWIWLQRIKDLWSIPQQLVGFAGLTPFSALPLVPLTWLDALDAKRVWLVANLAILAASLYGIQKITSVSGRHVAMIAFLAIIPLRNNFLLGQMHLVVLGLLALAYWFDTRKMWFSCSLTLAIAASLKVYPLFFLFYFLRKRQWKSATVLATSTLAILAACFVLFGTPVMHVFLIEQFPRMLRGEVIDPFSLTVPSASGLFHHVFLTQTLVNPHPIYSSPLLYAMLYPLWQLILLCATLLAISPGDTDPRRRSLEWASWICLLMTLSTQPASYHLIVLSFVAILAVHAVQNPWRRVILLGFYFMACNIHPSTPALSPLLALLFDFLPYWGLLAMLVCLLAALRTRPIDQLGPWSKWPRTQIAWALPGFAIVWCLASTTTFAHERSLVSSDYLQNFARGSYAQFALHQAGNHLLDIAMFPQGYRVEDENGRRYQTGADGQEEDQLAIASSPGANNLWIEAVTQGESRLVELPVTSSGTTSTAPIATIPNAESPTLSRDGRSLSFLREVNGAGRAWMVHLDENGRVLDEPLPITPRGMDVWNAAFAAPDVILLSAAEGGVSHLFVMHSGELPQRIYADGIAMDSPNVKAENGQLIYRQRDGSYWHLFTANPSRGGAEQLTFGDCNAYDPAWSGATTLLYISDCGRGIGLGSLAVSHINTAPEEPGSSLSSESPTNRLQGEAQR
jgi:hypothetical protein